MICMQMIDGMPIVLVPHIPDTTVWFAGEYSFYGQRTLFVGTQLPDLREQCRRQARMTVRRGLADVLEWLGEPVVTEPVLALLEERIRRDGRSVDVRL